MVRRKEGRIVSLSPYEGAGMVKVEDQLMCFSNRTADFVRSLRKDQEVELILQPRMKGFIITSVQPIRKGRK